MAQRTLAELLNTNDPAWPLLLDSIRQAENPVVVLPADATNRERVLVETQVTTRSTLGGIVFETGGILIDHGWVRILASGHPQLPRTVLNRNAAGSTADDGDEPGYLLVADDAVGGFFAINGGGLGPDTGNVHYLAPDTLRWETLDRGYSDFVEWCLSGDLAGFYEGQRWSGWEAEVASAGGDRTFHFYPPLFTDGPAIDDRSRKAVPASEAFQMAFDLAG